MHRMRRLLVVAYHFPPEPAAGALRPGYLASYLPDFGWEVTVLTRVPQSKPPVPATRARVLTAPVFGEALERSVRGALLSGKRAHAEGRPSPLRRALRFAKRTLAFPDPAAGVAAGRRLPRLCCWTGWEF